MGRNKKVSSKGLSDQAVDTMEKAFEETQKGHKKVCKSKKVKTGSALTKALDGLCEVGHVLKKATKNEINSKGDMRNSVKCYRNVALKFKTLKVEIDSKE